MFYEKSNTKKFFVETSCGSCNYTFIWCHALTQNELYMVCFSSFEKQENLKIVSWGEKHIFETGKEMFILDKTFSIIATYEFTSPLIGFYVINKNYILALEEVYLRVIGSDGAVIKSENIDFIDDFTLDNGILTLKSDGIEKRYDLFPEL
jgi:hypothetical protein